MLLVTLAYIALVFFMLVFAVHVLLTRHGNRFLNGLLGILLMGRGLQYMYGWLAENGHLSELTYVYKVPNALLYITPAAFFLYIKGFVSDRYTLVRYEWLHFLPAGIGVYEAAAWLAQPAGLRSRLLHEVDIHRSFFPDDASGFLSPEMSLLLRTSMFLVYVGLAWGYVLRMGILKTYRTNRIGCTWVFTLLSLATIGYLNVFISMVWDFYHPDQTHAGFLDSVRFSILIYACIMLFVFRNPRVMYGYAYAAATLDPPQLHRPTEPEIWQSFHTSTAGSDNSRMPAPSTSRPATADGRQAPSPATTVSREQIDAWRVALLAHMDHQMPYLNPGLRLHHLAEALDIAPHHCSYLINIEFGKNFNHWVNEYRVRHFMGLYHRHASTHTLEALARESGFSNRRTLHNAFLKVHGQPPGSYFQKQDGNTPVGQP